MKFSVQTAVLPELTRAEVVEKLIKLGFRVAVQSGDANAQGYREFTLGEFRFKRDEFFAYIAWPTGSITPRCRAT